MSKRYSKFTVSKWKYTSLLVFYTAYIPTRFDWFDFIDLDINENTKLSDFAQRNHNEILQKCSIQVHYASGEKWLYIRVA
jgi:hypothetical protein